MNFRFRFPEVFTFPGSIVGSVRSIGLDYPKHRHFGFSDALAFSGSILGSVRSFVFYYRKHRPFGFDSKKCSPFWVRLLKAFDLLGSIIGSINPFRLQLSDAFDFSMSTGSARLFDFHTWKRATIRVRLLEASISRVRLSDALNFLGFTLGCARLF